MEKQRQSNFELLRLVCMLMVLVCHANGYVNEADLSGSTGVVRLLINQFCLVCVNVFVMISGWFGVNASWKGAFKLWFQVLYVTVLCVVVAFLAGIHIVHSCLKNMPVAVSPAVYVLADVFAVVVAAVLLHRVCARWAGA